MVAVNFNTRSIADYELFLNIRKCPVYHFKGTTAVVPDEYSSAIGVKIRKKRMPAYVPHENLFDYQGDISAMAIRKRKFAIFAECGYGKTLMFLEYARYVAKHIGGKILIVSPLMVCEQTCEEYERWYGSSDIVQLSASELQHWLNAKDGKQLGIVNFEAIREGLNPGKLSGLIIDECFPAGTLVDCIVDGVPVSQPIETLSPGDVIVNASGNDHVVQLRRKRVEYACVVKAGTDIPCSPNHPFFTQRGWVSAQDLEPGDSILTSSEAMRMVRDDIHSEGHVGAREILRSILLSEMENVATGTSEEGAYEGNTCEDRKKEGGVVCGSQSKSDWRVGSNQEPKSNCMSGSSEEDSSQVEGDEFQTFRAWGEWSRDDLAAIEAAGCIGDRLDSGVCVIAGRTTSRVSHELQNRLGEYRNASRYRSGWSLPQVAEGTRQEEGCETGFVRVESLTVLERGCSELDRYRDSDGSLYFYDIEAERHPSFSVNGLLVHNSSMLKSHYGAWGTRLIDLGRGLNWKLTGTGTPAPNDRIEYANQAVFLDRAKTVNEFLASYFVNRGETQNRWELKPHALKPFYRALADWSIFLNNPATYGWKDNVGVMPPIHINIDHIELTAEQRKAAQKLTGSLMTNNVGGIGDRGKLSQIAKGKNGMPTNKPEFIRNQVDGWQDESTIIWCRYNDEQDSMERLFPDAVSISGDTKDADRRERIHKFQRGEAKTMITKLKILGFGLNLQVCTRQIFSGLNDSYEEFHQGVKRSNRIGSTKPLNVHIPVTELEVPFIENVLRKAHRIEEDTKQQEQLFKEIGYAGIR